LTVRASVETQEGEVQRTTSSSRPANQGADVAPGRLYVLVGVPGSGKTTYARAALPHALRISLDDLRLMLSGRTFDARLEPAVAVAGEAVRDALAAYAAAHHVDLVFDATNVTRARRAPLIALARRLGLAPVAIYVDTPLAVAQERNGRRRVPVPRAVVENFDGRLEPPTTAEGFDEVIRVDGTTVKRTEK
jgi:predicted kinase